MFGLCFLYLCVLGLLVDVRAVVVEARRKDATTTEFLTADITRCCCELLIAHVGRLVTRRLIFVVEKKLLEFSESAGVCRLRGVNILP